MRRPDGRPRVQVHPGAGVVARHDDLVLVVPELPAAPAERVAELLRLCRRPDPGGAARMDALRALLDLPSAAGLPGFAALGHDGHALRVLVHGPVRVLVDGRVEVGTGGDGDRLPAERTLADGAWRAVSVVAGGVAGGVAGTDAVTGGVADSLPLDLEAGVVPGAGITVRPAAAGPAPVARTETALRPTVRFRSVLLGECAAAGTRGRPVPAPRPPLPVAGTEDSAPGSPDRDAEVVVEGVRCPQGHFTDPDLTGCRTCGAPVAAGAQRVRLPRPPLGILVTDGGTIYPVTGDLVIGREPDQAADVLSGRARPLPLRDAARSTSRVHARLTVRGWKVLLTDTSSANGTFVSGHGAGGPWLPAPPDAPVPLAHGDRIRLGRRQLMFDAWREAVVPQVFR